MNIFLRAFINTIVTFLILLGIAVSAYSYPLITFALIIFLLVYVFWINKLEDDETKKTDKDVQTDAPYWDE